MQKKVGNNDTHSSAAKAIMRHIGRGSRPVPAVFPISTLAQAFVISHQHDLLATYPSGFPASTLAAPHIISSQRGLFSVNQIILLLTLDLQVH